MRWILRLWFKPLFTGFFGIGEGPSSGETREAGKIGNVADFATSTGMGDVGAASNFWKSILSGDPSKIAQVLGPEISGINKQTQEQKKTTAEFGNRGGGTNSVMQSLDAGVRGAYNKMVSSLTTGAAGELGSIGSGLLSTGLAGHEAAFDTQKTIHDQTLAKWNDLFKSITSVAAAFVPGGGSAKAATPSLVNSAGSMTPSGVPEYGS